MDNVWTQQEAGWWTHPLLGGLVREKDRKWHWHPLNSTAKHRGPWLSLREAMEALKDE